MSRESREKTFTINLRQKKAEIKQLLAPLARLCLVEEINGRRKKVICCIPPGRAGWPAGRPADGGSVAGQYLSCAKERDYSLTGKSCLQLT